MKEYTETSLKGLSVLVVDDEHMLRRRLSAHLQSLGAEVREAETLAEAKQSTSELAVDFILLDIHLPDGSGLDLLRDHCVADSTGVVVMTAQGGVEGAVEAMRLGAADYLVKPFEFGLLPIVMKRARRVRQASRVVEHVREAEGDERFFFGDALASLRNQLNQILSADLRLGSHLPPVLITGETGTGKTSIARWLHLHGPRASEPLVEVNCSALPDTLAEAELFGNERGAFTDARAARQGLFEAAHGGSLLLDELPSLSPAVQAKVLTVIEDRMIRRLGGNRQIQVDVRVIAATSQSLSGLVEAGEFRQDLMHRLDLFRVDLPPLRDRGTDILQLADVLLAQLCRRHRLPDRQITDEGRRRLLAYRWPGNVRELAHELERGLVFEDSAALDLEHLPGGSPAAVPGDWLSPGYRFPEEGFVLEDAINRLVQQALKQSEGNVSHAARLLGVTRDFVRYHLHGSRKEKS